MEDWLRFSVCFWHTFRGTGNQRRGGEGRKREGTYIQQVGTSLAGYIRLPLVAKEYCIAETFKVVICGNRITTDYILSSSFEIRAKLTL